MAGDGEQGERKAGSLAPPATSRLRPLSSIEPSPSFRMHFTRHKPTSSPLFWEALSNLCSQQDTGSISMSQTPRDDVTWGLRRGLSPGPGSVSFWGWNHSGMLFMARIQVRALASSPGSVSTEQVCLNKTENKEGREERKEINAERLSSRGGFHKPKLRGVI